MYVCTHGNNYIITRKVCIILMYVYPHGNHIITRKLCIIIMYVCMYVCMCVCMPTCVHVRA